MFCAARFNAIAGNDASLTTKASNCLHAPQPVQPPPAAVMDTDRTSLAASHTPLDPAAAANDIAAPARKTHLTELEGDSTMADMQIDQSTHVSPKPPSGTNGESLGTSGESLGTNGEALGTSGEAQNAAGTVALDNAAAAPAQSTATAANPVTQARTDAVPHHHVTSGATDTVLSVTKPDAASQPRAGTTAPCVVVPGSVPEAPVASFTAETSLGKALSGTPAATVADSKGGAMADAQANSLVDCEADPEAEAMAQTTADDNLGQVRDAVQGSREHAEVVPEAGAVAAAEADMAQRDMEAEAAGPPGQLTTHLPFTAASEKASVPTSNLSKAAAVADAAVLPMAASQAAAESGAAQPEASLHARLPDARSAEARASLPAIAKVFKPPAGWAATAGAAAQSRRRSANSRAVEAKAGRAVASLQQGPHVGSSDAMAAATEAVPTAVAASTSRQTSGRRAVKAPGAAPAAAPVAALVTAPATAPAKAPATAVAPAASDGKDFVGRRIEIWWSKDKAFYPGVVKSYNHRKVTAAMCQKSYRQLVPCTMSSDDCTGALIFGFSAVGVYAWAWTDCSIRISS